MSTTTLASVPDSTEQLQAEHDAEETRHLLESIATPSAGDLYAKATAIRERFGYRGELTIELYAALQELLDTPIDEKFVRTTRATLSKPYPSTGLRSLQPQTNQLNAILGRPHWRALCELDYIEAEGMQCRAHVIVGNNLTAARLDEHGELDAGDAKILVHVEGHGCQREGTNLGDLKKAARTNALKRLLAELGPGGNVYCGELDPDLTGEGEEYTSAGTPSLAAINFDVKANDGQQRLLMAKQVEHGVTNAELINFVYYAAGSDNRVTADEATREQRDAALQWLPRGLVNSVRDLVTGRTTMPSHLTSVGDAINDLRATGTPETPPASAAGTSAAAERVASSEVGAERELAPIRVPTPAAATAEIAPESDRDDLSGFGE